MIIGVDAGALSIRDDRLKVGVYRVTLEVLKAISSLDTTNEYRLYSFQPIERSILKNFGKNMKNVVLSPATGFFSFRLPLELLIHPVGVFLGVSQAIPVMTKGRAIGFVHDLGFIHAPHLYGKDAKSLTAQPKHLVKYSDHIVAVSQTVKDDIISQFGTSKEKITVCHEGVSSIFSSDVTPMRSANPYFLFVGSLRKGKNIDALVTLFHTFLMQSKKPFDLVLVGGDFWPDENIEKTIKKYHLEERVRRVGVVSDEDLARYYRGAVGFVTASASEGFCLPAVEALSSGCPVIAYEIGAIGEVVGNAGLLAPVGDSETFIRHMRSMSENLKKRNELVASGKTIAREYSWSGFAQKILHIIHDTR